MRRRRFKLTLTLIVCATVFTAEQNAGSDLAAGAPAVMLNAENAAPRSVEYTTKMAVERDYAAAWKSLTEALDRNQADLLNANFVGAAKDRLTATIDAQRKANLHQHYVDQGHSVDLVFYSPDGSAIELHDTARLGLQLLDGNRVVHSENATIHYVVLLTAAENSWNVRLLQAVPAF
jgi:hypothetical protein